MALLFHFNTPKPRQFKYRPLYYDERKERLEKMKAQAEAEFAAGRDRTGYIGLKKGFLSEHRNESKGLKIKLQSPSIIRVILFFVLIAALLYAFYLYDPELFKAFWKIK